MLDFAKSMKQFLTSLKNILWKDVFFTIYVQKGKSYEVKGDLPS